MFHWPGSRPGTAGGVGRAAERLGVQGTPDEGEGLTEGERGPAPRCPKGSGEPLLLGVWGREDRALIVTMVVAMVTEMTGSGGELVGSHHVGVGDDWRKQQVTGGAVRVAVEETLDRLAEKFTRQRYARKCDLLYQHVFDSYWDDGHFVYDMADVGIDPGRGYIGRHPIKDCPGSWTAIRGKGPRGGQAAPAL
jgi:hypothetical protein